MKNRLQIAGVSQMKQCREENRNCFECINYWNDKCIENLQTITRTIVERREEHDIPVIRIKTNKRFMGFDQLSLWDTRQFVDTGYIKSALSGRRVISLEELNYLKLKIKNHGQK